MGIPAEPYRLNLGAGNKAIAGYVSVGLDTHHTIHADLRDLSVIPDEVADDAIAIHVVEHILPWEVPAMLLEWKRVLKPGGTLAVELPDIMKCARNIVSGRPEQEGIMGVFGDPSLRDETMLHRFGYTADSMKVLLRAAGFIKVREASPQFHGKRSHRDMRVEARKP